MGPHQSNPEEAVAMSRKERVIPVYAGGDFTVVDWYTLSSDDGSPIPPGSSSDSPFLYLRLISATGG